MTHSGRRPPVLLALTAERVRVGLPGDTFATNVIVAGGQLVGGWKRTVKGRNIVLQGFLAVDLSDAQMRSIEKQARRYGEFLGATVDLTIDRKYIF